MKDKARAMYVMMTEIKRANFEGKQVVTGFTCHKGDSGGHSVAAVAADQSGRRGGP